MDVILSHAVGAHPVPKPATQPTLAFDRLQLPVIAGHLQASDDRIIAAALRSLAKLMTDYKSAPKAHDAGLPELLSALATHTGSTRVEIARMSLDCIRLILMSPALRRESASNPAIVEALKRGIQDVDPECRRLAYEALEAATVAHESAASLIESGFVRALVLRVRVETAEAVSSANAAAPLLTRALLVLRGLLRVHGSKAVDFAIMEGAAIILQDALQARDALSDAPLCAACECLALLAFEPTAKRQVIERAGAVELLVGLCGAARSSALAAAAASVLMGVAIDNDGKTAILKASLSNLIVLVNPAGDIVAAANACRTLASAASEPSGRAALRAAPGFIDTLTVCSSHSSSLLARAAAAALQVVQWSP